MSTSICIVTKKLMSSNSASILVYHLEKEVILFFIGLVDFQPSYKLSFTAGMIQSLPKTTQHDKCSCPNHKLLTSFVDTINHHFVVSENLYLQFEFICGATFLLEPYPSDYEGRFLTVEQ